MFEQTLVTTSFIYNCFAVGLDRSVLYAGTGRISA